MEELHSRRDAKGAEICLFDYPHGLRPSCSDNFVHLRLNPFGARESSGGSRRRARREATGEDEEEGEGRKATVAGAALR